MLKTTEGKGTYFIDPRNITVREDFNARVEFDIEELAEQIQRFGLKNPIKVKPYHDDTSNTEKYELIDGERRYRAIMSLIENGVTCAATEKVEVQFSDETSERDLLLTQVLCNQGKPFTDYEYAMWYKKMCFDDDGNEIMTYGKAAELISKPAWHGSICSLITRLSPESQEHFRKGEMNVALLRRLRQATSSAYKDQDLTPEELDVIVSTIIEDTAKHNPLKGKKKYKISDFNFGFKTINQLDTITIKKGLNALKKYVNSLTENGYLLKPFSTAMLLEDLNNAPAGTYINDILDGYKVKETIKETVNA